MPDAKLISRIAARRKPRWVAPEKGHSANDKVRSSQERETASRRSLFGLEEIHQGAINNAEERSERNAETTRAEVIKQFKRAEYAETVLAVAGNELKALANRVELIDRIKDGFDIRGIFVTNSVADPSAKTFLTTHPHIVLYDGVRLRNEFITIEKTDPIAATFTFDVSTVPTLKFPIGTNLTMVLAPISARELIAMEGVSNGDLFAWNVRQFLGRGTSVNKAVAESIKTPTEHKYFPAFHNGVTILCKSLTASDKTIEISGYAVVNGCQHKKGKPVK